MHKALADIRSDGAMPTGKPGSRHRSCVVRHMAQVTGSYYSDVMKQFDRITQKPDIMGGKACIRGMRVTAAMIVKQVGAGRAVDDILKDYPYLERDDVFQAIRYAAWLAEGQELALADDA